VSRGNLIRSAVWIAFVAMLSVSLSACGSKRKKYLAQVMPLVEMNDRIDSKVSKLPTINAYKYPDYLEKLDSYIATKQSIRGQMELVEAPFMQATVHNKLLIAMNNGIRYLQSEREKFVIAAEKMRKTVPMAPKGRLEYEIIREYHSQTAAYQANIKEQLMKKQYERLYWEAKDDLARIAKQ